MTPEHRQALERDFDLAMMRLYEDAKSQAHYNATRFFAMLDEHGGIETARRLLPSMSDGFVELWKRKRLDLTMEALIAQPRWRELFSDQERATARRRLLDCGWTSGDASSS